MVKIVPVNPGAGSSNAVPQTKIITPNGDSVTNDTADSLKVTIYDATGSAVQFGDTAVIPTGGSSQTIKQGGQFTTGAMPDVNDVYTVTANKDLYLTDLMIQQNGAAGKVGLYDDDTEIFSFYTSGVTHFKFSTPIKITTILTLKSTSLSYEMFWSGVEQ